MSRSFRKNPVIKDNKRTSKKFARQKASGTLRCKLRIFISDILPGLAQGINYADIQAKIALRESLLIPGDYRHFSHWFSQYDIYDYRSRYTFRDYLERKSCCSPGGSGRHYAYSSIKKSWRDFTEEEQKMWLNKWRREMYWK